MRTVACSIALAFVSLGSVAANGATLLSVKLTTDGSIEPPGDTITTQLYFAEGEQLVRLQVRAFVIEGPDRNSMTRVVARDDAHRDQEGNFLLSRTLAPGESRHISSTLTIPYQSLALAPGEHLLGYEVLLLQEDGALSVARALPLTKVRITEGPRTVIHSSASPPSVETRTVETTAVVLDPAGLPTVVKKTFEMRVTVATRDIKENRVNIPGGYEREPAAPHIPDPLKSPLENYVEHLDRAPWIPLRRRLVYYATNRNIADRAKSTGERFAAKSSDETSYGSVLVNIPSEESHERGRLEVPRWWERRNPDKHFSVETGNTFSRRILLDSIATDDILLFIHGFNTTFDDAVLRMAQVTHDVQFRGHSLAFCWPSQGKKSMYKEDEIEAKKSARALTDLLAGLSEAVRGAPEKRRPRIHVLAHSMGNRILLESMHELDAKLPNEERPFGHVALIAADVDLAEFVKWLPAVHRKSVSVSMYFNPDDLALKASRLVHVAKRAGELPLLVGELENIDAQKANTSGLGHGYFAAEDELLIDLQLLINHNLRPPGRPTVRERRTADRFTYWFFP